MPAEALHTMIRVLDLDRSIEFYRKTLGLAVADRFDFDSFTLVYLRNEESPFELELVANADAEEPYDLGTGYGHFAVRVDDVEAERVRIAGLGLAPEPIKELSHRGELLGRYFFLSDPDGYRVELLERAGRFA
jgi:lactoylglutathione lyase